ncbi:MAG: MHS family MFS transporter [Actinobacteria bacterium]|nr:MHS family MFS transporter [Actinomycetota bacterium]
MDRSSREDAGQMSSVRQVLGASFIGTTIEWYDFFIYGTAATLVFGQLFFSPSFSPLAATMSSVATFAVGFVARPLGGIVFGHFGDKLGRKAMLVITLNMMGIATFLVGVLPTFESIGLLAPILLVLLRVVQGLGVGGEWGGAALMAVEYAPENRRGYYGSWPQMGVPAGLLLATGIFGAVSFLPNEQFLAWGWRIPFLLSIILVGVGLFVRLRLLETPAFSEVQESDTEAQMPIMDVLRNYPRNVLLAIGARVASDGSFYVFTVFILDYATRTLGLPRSTILLGVAVASAIEIFTIPIFGLISDCTGRRPIYLVGTVLLIVLAYPYFLMIQTGSTVLVLLASILALSVAHATMYGPMSAYFAELFGTRVRYSGVSLGYQLASIIGGGAGPLISIYLVGATGGAFWPVVVWMVALCLITLVCVLVAAETFRGGEFSAERSGQRQPAAEQG